MIMSFNTYWQPKEITLVISWGTTKIYLICKLRGQLKEERGICHRGSPTPALVEAITELNGPVSASDAFGVGISRCLSSSWPYWAFGTIAIPLLKGCVPLSKGCVPLSKGIICEKLRCETVRINLFCFHSGFNKNGWNTIQKYLR